jgi:hypothetical protein
MSAPSPPPRRHYLGSSLGFTERLRVFRTEDALEVDSSDRYEIRRRRVFFDEVLLATLHREIGGGPRPWALAALTALAGLLGFAFSSEPSAQRIFLASTVALGLFALADFLLPSWVVTVYGKRARARIRYRLRPAKAQTVYDEICAAAAEAQRALAERQAVRPPEPDLPPPPPAPYSA